MLDRKGVLNGHRNALNAYKQQWINHETSANTLEEAMHDADVFVGLAGPDLLNESMLKSMAKNPILFALSNPNPEIDPKLASQIRPDAIIATGRSDFPNQINNVLCFPYIFRGALDARAKSITLKMKLAAMQAIAQCAESSDKFGKNWIVPLPTDPKLKETVSDAVRNAADH